ncbi:unnamed protein product, partial [Prorocentrum cordatum]
VCPRRPRSRRGRQTPGQGGRPPPWSSPSLECAQCSGTSPDGMRGGCQSAGWSHTGPGRADGACTTPTRCACCGAPRREIWGTRGTPRRWSPARWARSAEGDGKRAAQTPRLTQLADDPEVGWACRPTPFSSLGGQRRGASLADPLDWAVTPKGPLGGASAAGSPPGGGARACRIEQEREEAALIESVAQEVRGLRALLHIGRS